MEATSHELLERVSELWQLSPDIRFGQFLANLAFLVEDQGDQSLWDIEDTRLLEIVKKHRADLIRHQQISAKSVDLLEERRPTVES